MWGRVTYTYVCTARERVWNWLANFLPLNLTMCCQYTWHQFVWALVRLVCFFLFYSFVSFFLSFFSSFYSLFVLRKQIVNIVEGPKLIKIIFMNVYVYICMVYNACSRHLSGLLVTTTYTSQCSSFPLLCFLQRVVVLLLLFFFLFSSSLLCYLEVQSLVDYGNTNRSSMHLTGKRINVLLYSKKKIEGWCPVICTLSSILSP